MTDNNTTPTPDQMGDQLDEELKDTVQEWAEAQEGDYENLDDRIDQRLRRMVAGWVGAEEDADWKAIGTKTDANTRAAVAKWVGAEDDADWGTISGRMENRIRLGVARLVKAQHKAPEGEEAPEAEASWSDIGSKVEHDMRGWIASVVGTEKDADWKTIGDQMMDHVKNAFDTISENLKKSGDKGKTHTPSEKIEIHSDGDSAAPKVTSEEPVDPDA